MNSQVVPGVRIDLSNMKSTTRFNDLHEDIQKGIADIDKFIQNCMSQKDQLDAFMPAHGEQLSAIPGDVRFVGRKYAAVDSALAADLHAIKQTRDLVKSDAEEAGLSFSAVENLMLPSQYHVNNAPVFFGSSNRDGSGSGGKAGADDDKTASDLVGYFSKQVDEMDEQIKRFQKNVREIEMHLSGVQQNVMDQASRLQNGGGGGFGAGSAEEKQMELYAVLRDFEESILQVAGVVGAGREGVTELQLSDFRGRGLNGGTPSYV
jgi:nucleoporin p58/p45